MTMSVTFMFFSCWMVFYLKEEQALGGLSAGVSEDSLVAQLPPDVLRPLTPKSFVCPADSWPLCFMPVFNIELLELKS